MGIISRGLFVGAATLGLVVQGEAALYGRLPLTPGGTDYQAYWDDQLHVTWTANGDINGLMDWVTAKAWAAGLTVAGVDGWRVASMDVNGDGVVVDCAHVSEAACQDNEYAYMILYNGVSGSSAPPFVDVRANFYVSGTPHATNPDWAWTINFADGYWVAGPKTTAYYAWAVHPGDVSVPEPAALGLMGVGLAMLVGWRRRRR